MNDNITIRSIVGEVHDLGHGGYKFKVVVMVSMPVGYYNSFKVIKKRTSGLFGSSPAIRSLGGLVIDVNNELYGKYNIPAINPSIDSTGGKKSKNGVKTLKFEYFFNDIEVAKNLGFRFIGNTDFPHYINFVKIL